MRGESRGDKTRHDHLGRKSEQISHLLLAFDDHRGDDTAEALFACSEKEAPAERVDRSAPYQRVAIEVAVDRCEHAKVGHDEQQDRDFVDVLRKPARPAAAAAANSGALARAAASASRSVTGAHGTSPAAPIARYSYQPSR